MAGNEFKDHFSQAAGTYQAFRPRYPEALFAWLASIAPRRESAWDCGCGNGQAAVGLVPYFARIIATDPSAEQIRHALPHPQIEYRVAPAEDSGLDPQSIDLIVVAQALHWFDLDRFYAEARRVGRPGAIVAAVSYGLLQVGEEIDRLLAPFYGDLLGPFWPPERRHVDEGYRSLPFPFPELQAPAMAMEAEWELDHLLGYLGTWSAVKEYRLARGEDPLAGLAPALAGAWGERSARRRVRWPLSFRVGRIG